MDKITFLNLLDLDPDEPIPMVFRPSGDRLWWSAEYANNLRQRLFGFAWDDKFWRLHVAGQGVLEHDVQDYWDLVEPPWTTMRKELRWVSGYTRTAPLLPVADRPKTNAGGSFGTTEDEQSFPTGGE